MKKLFTYLFLFGCFTQLNAQSWFSEESQWQYQFFGFESSGNIILTVGIDTLIANQNYKVLKREKREYTSPSTDIDTVKSEQYVREEGGLVFQLDYNNEEIMIYDFTLNVGDSYNILQNYCAITYLIEVVGTIDIDGQSLIYQDVLVSSPDFLYDDFRVRFIEKIGCAMYFNQETQEFEQNGYFFFNEAFPFVCHTDADYRFFECYRDESIEAYPSDADCELLQNIDLTYQIGTKWAYEYFDFVIGTPDGAVYDTTCVVFEIVDTTTINGMGVLEIHSDLLSNCSNPLVNYIYTEEDQVYIYDSDLDTFNLLYDFNNETQYEALWGTQEFMEVAIVNIDSINSYSLPNEDDSQIQHVSISNNGTLEGDLHFDIINGIGKTYGGLYFPLGEGLCDVFDFTGDLISFENGGEILSFKEVACNNENSWFEHNPVWKYHFAHFEGEGGAIMSIQGDTIIENRSCLVFETAIDFELFPDTLSATSLRYAYEDGDIVYVYHPGNGFEAIYNFNLEVGDTLTYTDISSLCDISYVIEATGTNQIGNEVLRYQDVGFISYQYLLHVRFYEKMGLVEDINEEQGAFFNYFFIDAQDGLVCYPIEHGYHFCSYEDQIVGLYNPTGENCDFIDATEDTSQDDKLNLSPNPFSDMITINTAETIQNLRLINLNGQIILENNNKSDMNTSNIPKGIYFLEISFKNGAKRVEKVVKVPNN